MLKKHRINNNKKKSTLSNGSDLSMNIATAAMANIDKSINPKRTKRMLSNAS